MGSLALSLVGAPASGQRLPTEPPQRGGQPRQDTPYILVAAFRSDDRVLGVETADEVRKRLSNEHSAQELFVVLKRNINATLEASGYRPDSALNPSDLMELSKQLHGEYVIDAKVSKHSPGVRIEPRVMLRTGTQTLAQPLPTVDGKDAGDIAKGVEKAISDAIRGMKPYKDCIADLRAQRFDQAVTDARLGIQAYANSSLSRLCLLTAYTSLKSPADSVIAVSNAILAIDPSSMIALVNLGDAYLQKGDTAKAIDTKVRIYEADPANVANAMSIINDLGKLGANKKALAILDALLKDNPTDASLLHTKWALQLNDKQYKQALATGEELVKLDSSIATQAFTDREIGAAQSDSNAAAVLQLATKASVRFPKEVRYTNLLAASYLKAGQLPQALEAARRSAGIDPKSPGAWQFVMAIQNQMHQPDSVMASAQKAVAGGVPKDSIGASLVTLISPALQKAQEVKTREGWDDLLKTAQTVDGIVSSQQSKFYLGFAAYNIGADAVSSVQKLYNGSKADKAKACTEAKVAEDNFAIASVAIVAGGKHDPAVAGQIMTGLSGAGDFVTQVKAALKCK